MRQACTHAFVLHACKHECIQCATCFTPQMRHVCWHSSMWPGNGQCHQLYRYGPYSDGLYSYGGVLGNSKCHRPSLAPEASSRCHPNLNNETLFVYTCVHACTACARGHVHVHMHVAIKCRLPVVVPSCVTRWNGQTLKWYPVARMAKHLVVCGQPMADPIRIAKHLWPFRASLPPNRHFGAYATAPLPTYQLAAYASSAGSAWSHGRFRVLANTCVIALTAVVRAVWWWVWRANGVAMPCILVGERQKCLVGATIDAAESHAMRLLDVPIKA